MSTKMDYKIDSFMNELESLYRKYGLSIAHEDNQGAFLIQKFSDDNLQWIRNAQIQIFDEE